MGTQGPVVAIVGAGPAGLVIAHILHRAGISFVLFERQESSVLRTRVKAGMIEHRTLDLLERHGLAEPILERGSRMGMCEFRADGESFIVDYASLCGGVGHYIYHQHELVGDWAERLAAEAATFASPSESLTLRSAMTVSRSRRWMHQATLLALTAKS
jgi:p-hydroxybenzoate 3-monooxygenase